MGGRDRKDVTNRGIDRVLQSPLDPLGLQTCREATASRAVVITVINFTKCLEVR